MCRRAGADVVHARARVCVCVCVCVRVRVCAGLPRCGGRWRRFASVRRCACPCSSSSSGPEPRRQRKVPFGRLAGGAEGSSVKRWCLSFFSDRFTKSSPPTNAVGLASAPARKQTSRRHRSITDQDPDQGKFAAPISIQSDSSHRRSDGRRRRSSVTDRGGAALSVQAATALELRICTLQHTGHMHARQAQLASSVHCSTRTAFSPRPRRPRAATSCEGVRGGMSTACSPPQIRRSGMTRPPCQSCQDAARWTWAWTWRAWCTCT